MQLECYKTAVQSMSKHKLENLRKLCLEELRKRYRRNRQRKYGNLYKGFTSEELKTFFLHVQNEKALLCFVIQAYAGLRVSEAVKVKGSDVDFDRKMLRVHSAKSNTFDEVPLHPYLYGALEDAVDLRGLGYLMPGQKLPYISPVWVRKEFRESVVRAGLDSTYGWSEEPSGKSTRKLHRLTTHSLRHFFITSIYNSCKNLKVAQRLARHTDMGTTQVYIHTNQDQMREAVMSAFLPCDDQEL